jgi:hypothetical protein
MDAKLGTQDSSDDPTEIAIRLHSIGQLFDTFDPSPFREKDLDKNAEEFIVGWVRELAPTSWFEIVVHLPPEEAARPEAERIGEALANYFESRAVQFDREQRELFRIGRRSLAIGVPVLAACLAASQLLAPLIPNETLARIVRESLIIVGWVANWRPIEIYLYGWLPLARQRRLYRRIAAAPVIVKVG